MNGNFICIKVKRTDGMSAVINVEAIDSICEEDGGVLITAGRTMHSVRCTLDEAIEAVTKNCSFLAQMPLLGFDDEPTEEIEEDAIEPEEAEHVEAEPAEAEPSPTEERIVNALDELATFCRYGDLQAVYDTIGIRIRVDGELRRVTSFTQSDNGLRVSVQGVANGIAFSSLPELDQDLVLGEVMDIYRWEAVYDSLSRIPTESYVNAHNIGEEPKNRILPNTEESLDAFGMSAGKLMKSMVNGNYKRDEAWIYIERDELKSTNNPALQIDCCALTDWLFINPDEAKKVLPADVYAKVFE